MMKENGVEEINGKFVSLCVSVIFYLYKNVIF